MTLDHLLVIIVDIIVGILGALIGFLLIGDWLAVQFRHRTPLRPRQRKHPHLKPPRRLVAPL